MTNKEVSGRFRWSWALLKVWNADLWRSHNGMCCYEKRNQHCFPKAILCIDQINVQYIGTIHNKEENKKPPTG